MCSFPTFYSFPIFTAVVTPITVSIGMAFRRREQALYQITRIRSFSFQIYLAHAIWDWNGGDGRNNSYASKVGNVVTKISEEPGSEHDDDDAFITPPESGYYDNETNMAISWLQHSDIVLEHLVGIGDEVLPS